MITTLLIIFIVGYILIASEHILGVNKATFALIMCGLLWAVYSLCVAMTPTFHTKWLKPWAILVR